MACGTDSTKLFRLVEAQPSEVELFANVRDVCGVDEVAEVLGVVPATVRREIQRGKLGCIHIGRAVRITKQQLIEYVRECAK